MSTDYQGNSKAKKQPKEIAPKPKVERVVATEVIVQRRGLGQKFKDLFIEANPKSVIRYVAAAVLVPAAKNMAVDAITEFAKRTAYGETAVRRSSYGPGSRITYNNPINRTGYRESPMRHAPPVSPEPRSISRRAQDTFIITSKEEAQIVLERLNDLIDTYERATLADLKDLIGEATTHVDNMWGWIYLADAQIRQVREGYLLDLPPVEALQ